MISLLLLYSFIIRAIQRMRWAENVARIGDRRDVYRILVARTDWRKKNTWQIQSYMRR